MRRRRHGGVRSARGYLESPKRPGRARVGFGLINARIPGGQRSSACISSRITTVIRVTVGATKGTITDLMSHSQFHCHARVYLDMHGLIFETSICYWQDQPGSRRSCAEDRSRRRSGPATARAERRQGPAPGHPLRRVAGGRRGGPRRSRRSGQGAGGPSEAFPARPFGGLSGRVGARGGAREKVAPSERRANAGGGAAALGGRGTRRRASRSAEEDSCDPQPGAARGRRHAAARARRRTGADPPGGGSAPPVTLRGSPRRGGVRSA